ncbi:MAG: hypothetical protein IPK15_25055 [Verrucomicrobia bacterium]|nr:hypothetical protein [Verrucomicrobiota bacterium]
MDSQPPKYRREFFKSPHHVWLGLLTLGAGLIIGADYRIALLAAPAAYALGWVYLPDVGFFRRWVDRRRQSAQQAIRTGRGGGISQRSGTNCWPNFPLRVASITTR